MSSSPYGKTSIGNSGTLDVLTIRPVPAYADDPLYTVEPQYLHRPDLLAYDMYGDNRLWWIFTQRNLDVLEDPIYDFESGVEILLMSADSVSDMLG